ncbi:MAG: CDP-alcohol phosphatidyltransferase family protein [Actinomycetota bacterium]|nr:CDP-alcohol phosphatidyltransferase family protein [Actinomycetota bacterium]
MSGPGTSTGAEKIFGPTALATPANALTLARLLASPVLAVLVGTVGPSSWLLFLLWTVLAGSDGVDGRLARRQGSTRSGAFLDPLADKFLVIGALAALAASGVVSALPVALIFAREAAMTAFRVYAGRRGVSVPARPLAKVKTLVQCVAVAMAFFPPIGVGHEGAVRVTVWVAVVLTVYTGGEYLFDSRRMLRSVGAEAA